MTNLMDGKNRGEFLSIFALLMAISPGLFAATPPDLRVGYAQYAFDHMGDMGKLGPTAAASGVNIIFAGGVGIYGYQGMPEPARLEADMRDEQNYLADCRAKGIRRVIGYVCATSIVNLNSFDRNWTPEFRARFKTPPAQWRQLDKNGRPLASWYGAPYEPACMNNPDWRAYEKAVIKLQLDSGCDGIFFDNPTVHPEGCYCPACMEKFGKFAANRGEHPSDPLQWATNHPSEFLEFRAGIAADFLSEMRQYARSVKRGALMTCNNSLNSPDALFSQIRHMGYDIDSMSRAEDFITIEDMGSQARELADGRTIEYGPVYHLLHAINHDKPIVATTLSDADYHSSPNLARLSMAEAAANDASWMLWPFWPEEMRKSMAASILPEAQLLRDAQRDIGDVEPCGDVLLYLCHRRWLETDHCAALPLAQALSAANIQYTVCSEENLAKTLKSASVFLIESAGILNAREKREVDRFEHRGGHLISAADKNWLSQVRAAISEPSIQLKAPPSVRAIVWNGKNCKVIRLYNLNVRRLSSLKDQIYPAEDIKLTIRVPFKQVREVQAISAAQTEPKERTENLPWSSCADGAGTIVTATVPRLEDSAVIVVK